MAAATAFVCSCDAETYKKASASLDQPDQRSALRDAAPAALVTPGSAVRVSFLYGALHVELTPGVVIIFAVVVVVTIVLIRWSRRHEAAPPVDAPGTRVRNNTMAAREDRESPPLVHWLLDRASEQTGVRVDDDPLARERIVKAAEKAMEDLRTGGSATISLPFLTADAGGPKHFAVRFKRNPDSTFELQR